MCGGLLGWFGIESQLQSYKGMRFFFGWCGGPSEDGDSKLMERNECIRVIVRN